MKVIQGLSLLAAKQFTVSPIQVRIDGLLTGEFERGDIVNISRHQTSGDIKLFVGFVNALMGLKFISLREGSAGLLQILSGGIAIITRGLARGQGNIGESFGPVAAKSGIDTLRTIKNTARRIFGLYL